VQRPARRRGVEALFKLLREVKEAGSRIESVQEPQLGETDIGGAALTALSAIMSNQESVKKSERMRIAIDRVRDEGALWGNGQWGYEITGEKYRKKLVPNKEGERYIPEIFQRIADGESCHQVSEWLRAGPRPGISDKTVYRIIRNRIYMGVKMAKGKPVLKVTPLVDAKLWKMANDRLNNAPRGRRSPAKGQPAFLTSVLFCASCRKPDGKAAPMYRIRPRGNYFYYRCRGHAPELKGCGNMVRLEVLDSIVVTLLSMAHEPWTELRHIPGENYDAELVQVQLDLNDLPKQGLSDEEEDSERERLHAERNRLNELNKLGRPDHWEEVPTGETVGEHFTSLDFDGQRKMMLENVKAYAEKATIVALGIVAPIVRIESRLFKLLRLFSVDEPGDSEEGISSSSVVALRPTTPAAS
jgi:DNA invertase Pin-like site-specific DNA recombinase